jgi:ketosteroid isomerase-like protein
MSRENVHVVRRLYEAVARRDAAAVLTFYDPEVEWDHTHGPARELMGGPTVYHGHEGIRSWFREWYEAWGDGEAEVLELIDVGEHVISILNYRGRGRASGIPVEIARMAGVWTIREGKVVRAEWFGSREEALDAARRPE